MDAQLVFDGDAVGVIPFTQGTVVLDHELGHHEQGNALHPFGGVGRPGQHQVHHIFRHVVVAVGDENLLPEHLVAAVTHGFGPAAYGGQVGARIGFGQVHAAAIVAEVDNCRLENARRLFEEYGLPEGEAKARSLLLYAYVFGQSLMIYDRFDPSPASLRTWIADHIVRAEDR